MLTKKEIIIRLRECVARMGSNVYIVNNKDGKQRGEGVSHDMLLNWIVKVEDGCWKPHIEKSNLVTLMHYANQIWEKIHDERV